MKNKLVQNSLFVGITVALFVGVLFVSNANYALSQNDSNTENTNLGVSDNGTSVNSSSLDKEGNWTDGNATLTVTQ
ncbi:MAG TPA: hypothetical protein VJR94_00960 [Candidatus Nitrosocosmicus sp.]|jgi:hypothetical protein|nr:hypothetical protein [Candidatus Nitrosocosmicus sp.]